MLITLLEASTYISASIQLLFELLLHWVFSASIMTVEILRALTIVLDGEGVMGEVLPIGDLPNNEF